MARIRPAALEDAPGKSHRRRYIPGVMRGKRIVTRRSRKLTAATAILVAASLVGCGRTFLDDSANGGLGDGGSTRDGTVDDARDASTFLDDGGDAESASDAGGADRDASAKPCGNGLLDPGEACDDGNGASSDGCSASCKIEPGWTCSGAPSACESICGDGIVVGSETCDDSSSCLGTCRRTLWSKRYGNSAVQLASGVAVDPTGAAIVVGDFGGTIDFGGGFLGASGVGDGFVAKVDANGKHVWSRRFGGPNDDRAFAVATDAAGNVVVTGVFSGTVDFGGGPLVASGSWDMFVVKLDATGNHLWSKRFGNDQQQEGKAVAIDAAGNIIVAGMFWGTIDFGGGAITSTGIDVFVAKLDSAGNHVWSKAYGSPGVDGRGARGVAVSASGDVYVTGACAGVMDFGGGGVAEIGERDGFLLALDANGLHRWSKRWGSLNAYSSGTSVAVDPTGSVLVTGYSEGTIDLGTGVLPSKGSMDIVLGKFDPSGAPIFAKRYGSTKNDLANSVTTDGAGNILLTGYVTGPIDFGDGPLTYVGGQNTFIAKLTPTGAPSWSRLYKASFSLGVGIAADPMGNIFATGYFSNTIDFGTGTLSSGGAGYDVFLAKLTP